MEKIEDKNLKKYYIQQFNLLKYFQQGIEKQMSLVKFSKNEMMYQMEDAVEYFYFFVKGKAKVFIMLENGRSFLLRFYNPLMLIGDLEVANKNSTDSSTYIQAIQESLCIGIPMEYLQKHYQDDVKFLHLINQSISDKLLTISKVSSIHLLYPLKARLASYIISFSTGAQEAFEVDALVDISELLGTSYRHLLRTFQKFEEEKIIIRKGRTIEIRDYKRLQSISADVYD